MNLKVAAGRGPRDPTGMQASELMVGWTTLDDRDAALRLARGMVESGLVACAQVDGPVTSVYLWKGRVEEAPEYRVTAKFAAARSGDLARWIEAHHPYDTPQWIACRAADAGENYLKWIAGTST